MVKGKKGEYSPFFLTLRKNMLEARMQIMPQTFVVVGCGGTGSRLVPLLAQFIKTCQWIVDPIIFLVDDDVVEQKNLLRQNFILPDVGKPKAEVLATRYSKAYNVTIIPIVARVDDSGTAYNRIYSNNVLAKGLVGNVRASMIISCVDNMVARRNILNRFAYIWQNDGIFIDSGNEDVYGQIMVSNPKTLLTTNKKALNTKQVNEDYGFPEMMPVSAQVKYIPLDFNFYNNTEDKVSDKSCADLDQTMAINSMAATTIFGIIQNILYSRPLSFHRLNMTLSGIFPELLTVNSLVGLTAPSLNKLTSSVHKLYVYLTNIYDTDIYSFLTPLNDKYQQFLAEQKSKEKDISTTENIVKKKKAIKTSSAGDTPQTVSAHAVL